MLRKLPVAINITSLEFERVSKLYMVVNILKFWIRERVWILDILGKFSTVSRVDYLHMLHVSPRQECTIDNFTCKTPAD